jgi:SAM-dependent methyltransferase
MKFLSLENSLRKKIGSNGKRYIEANYQWVQVEKKYLDLLEKISPENKRYEYQKRDRLLSFVEAVDKLKTKYDAKVVTHLTHQHSARISCICDKLEQTGISPQYLELSKVEYEAYLSKAGYNESYYRDNFLEKSLEHFICYKLLELSENDVFVDIASEQSPFADIMHRLTGCTSYMQDIMYPLGISNNRIGGDAANMPVKDKCFSGASATCSLEHFEGDSDIRFMQEMSRVLNSGGRIVICPLYMYPTDCYITDPVMAISGNVPFDAPVFCIENWGNRHARFYSPETLVRRLITPNPSMKFEILVLKNPDEFSDPIHCYCRFILIGEKI